MVCHFVNDRGSSSSTISILHLAVLNIANVCTTPEQSIIESVDI
jgi:hypothetical protein